MPWWCSSATSQLQVWPPDLWLLAEWRFVCFLHIRMGFRIKLVLKMNKWMNNSSFFVKRLLFESWREHVSVFLWTWMSQTKWGVTHPVRQSVSENICWSAISSPITIRARSIIKMKSDTFWHMSCQTQLSPWNRYCVFYGRYDFVN